MSVLCIDPRSHPLWQDLVARRESSVFHSPAWMQVLTDTYGFDIRAHVYLNGEGEPEAGLPSVTLDDFRGKRIVTLPFSDHCDLLGSGETAWRSLVEAHLGKLPYSLRCLHNHQPLADSNFEVTNRAKWHGLDLRPELDDLWLGLHGSARGAVRKARREGVSVTAAQGKEDLRRFFELHLQVRKYKYGLLAQPFAFFDALWHRFVQRGEGVLLLATHHDRLIAGIFFLEWQGKLYYKFNASAYSQVSLRPNDLLLWEGVRYAKSKNLTHLDFGLSDWAQEGLLRYKRKFASEEKTITFLRHPATTAVEASSAEASKRIDELLPLLTNLLTDESVPDLITERAGALLYELFA